MAAVIIIFFSLGLGSFVSISAGALSYNFEFIEPVMLAVSFFIVIKSWKKSPSISITRTFIILVSVIISIFLYALFSFIWTDYGLSVLPGAIPLFYAILSILVGSYYLNNAPDLYILGSRVFILFLFLQLMLNIYSGFQTGANGFYAVKAFADTFIGKSNFISFFFVFDLIFEFISKEKHWKFFLLIDVLAVVLTVSRGAIVSLVIALITFFFLALFNDNFDAKKIILNYAVLGALFFLILIVTPSGQELLGGLGIGLEASTVGSRQLLWNDAIHEIAHNLMGIGIVWRDNPHNFLLDSLRNMGIVFGTIYILLIASPLYILLHPKVNQLSARSLAGVMAYLSVFLHSMIEVFYFTKVSVIWSFLTMLFVFYSIRKDLQQEKDYSILARKKFVVNNRIFEKFKNRGEGVQ